MTQDHSGDAQALETPTSDSGYSCMLHVDVQEREKLMVFDVCVCGVAFYSSITCSTILSSGNQVDGLALVQG